MFSRRVVNDAKLERSGACVRLPAAPVSCACNWFPVAKRCADHVGKWHRVVLPYRSWPGPIRTRPGPTWTVASNARPVSGTATPARSSITECTWSTWWPCPLIHLTARRPRRSYTLWTAYATPTWMPLRKAPGRVPISGPTPCAPGNPPACAAPFGNLGPLSFLCTLRSCPSFRSAGMHPARSFGVAHPPPC